MKTVAAVLDQKLLLNSAAALMISCAAVGCSHLQREDWHSIHFGHDYAIHEAAREGDLLKVSALVEEDGSVIGANDSCNLTPLHWAVLRGHIDLAAWLIENGAPVNAKTIHAQTPLSFAAQNGNTELVDLLLAHDADASLADDYGYTPAYRAEIFGYAHLAQRLRTLKGAPK